MKNFICCIIFIFTVFAHFSYAQQPSVIDTINQSEIIEKKVDNESPSYSLMDKAISLYKEESIQIQKKLLNLYYNKIHTIEKLWNICNV